MALVRLERLLFFPIVMLTCLAWLVEHQPGLIPLPSDTLGLKKGRKTVGLSRLTVLSLNLTLWDVKEPLGTL